MQVQNLDKWVIKYPNGIPHNDFQKRTEEKRRSGNGHATFLLNKQNAGAFDSWQSNKHNDKQSQESKRD